LTFTYHCFLIYPIISVTSAAVYTKSYCAYDSLEEVAYLDGEDDVKTMIKRVTCPGGTVTVGTGSTGFTPPNNVIPFFIRAEANMNLCVYYLKHMEQVQWITVVNSINLTLVHDYRNRHMYEESFKKTAGEPVINGKDWSRTLENIKVYLASQYGGTGAALDYVIRVKATSNTEADDPADAYEMVDQEMNAHAPHSGRHFVNDKRKVWDIMSRICGNNSFFVYIKPALRTKNGRDA
jgi:hypothetical protein